MNYISSDFAGRFQIRMKGSVQDCTLECGNDCCENIILNVVSLELRQVLEGIS